MFKNKMYRFFLNTVYNYIGLRSFVNRGLGAVSSPVSVCNLRQGLSQLSLASLWGR